MPFEAPLGSDLLSERSLIVTLFIEAHGKAGEPRSCLLSERCSDTAGIQAAAE